MSAPAIPLATRTVAEDISINQPQSELFDHISNFPPRIEFTQQAYDYFGYGASGEYYSIIHTSRGNGVEYSVHCLLPDNKSPGPMQDNIYRDIALAKARCNFLAMAMLYKEYKDRADKAEHLVEQYDIVVGGVV